MPTSNIRMPMELKNTGDGSGTEEAVKVPDCEVVMVLVGSHTPRGQKYCWTSFGVGAIPLGREVRVSEKPPM
jgi:hypothetical protein